MNKYDVLNALQKSFDDYILDNIERSELRLGIRSLSLEELHFLRNRAFELFEQEQGNPMALKWLSLVVKTLYANPPNVSQSSVCFSPGADCLQLVSGALRSAQQSLDVCVFTISDNRITDSILDAFYRGISLRIITDNDKCNDRGSDIDYLVSKGVEVRVDRSASHMHHKFAIIDDCTLLNGSFNWTRSASEYNQENVVLHSDLPIVQDFKKEFERLWNKFSLTG